MRQILKSSSKIGLVAAVLLLASACGGESERDALPSAVKAGSPLVEIEEIAAGDVCEHGGTMIINGVDKNDDGELSDDEIVSSKPVCKSAPGSNNEENEENEENEGNEEAKRSNPLIKSETLDVGDDECPHGGQRVIAGLDVDDDGDLSESEIESSIVLCKEVGVCTGATPLALVGVEFEKDPYNQYQVGLEYEIRLELNQSIDETRLKFHDASGVLGNGPLDYDVDEDNDHIAIVKWIPNEQGSTPILALIEDGCSLVAEDTNLPYASNPRVGIKVTSDKKGLLEEGEKTEICWTTRNVDSCEFYELNQLVGPVDTDGCRDLTLTDEHLNDASPVMNFYFRCEGTTDGVHTMTSAQLEINKEPKLRHFFGQQPMMFKADGGTVKFKWDTFGMESCVLSDGTDSTPVADEATAEAPHNVDITQTTRFELICEDVLGDTHKADRRYLVGPDISWFDGNLNPVGQTLSITYNTIDIDGTCDVKYSNNGQVFEYTDVVQGNPNENNGFEDRYTNIYKQNVDVSVLDMSKDQVFELTCSNAAGTESYSATFTK